MLSKNELFWLYLNNIEAITLGFFNGAYFKSVTYADFVADEDLMKALPHENRTELTDGTWYEKARLMAVDIVAKGINIAVYDSDRYPQALREIDKPPALIYYIGDISLCNMFCASIVGSRRSTSYGRGCAERFAGELAENGVCIVSGMAEGIDSCAHRAALKKNGKTVAVLGSGIDKVYPASNLELYEEICKSGLVISEFPLGETPKKGNFPQRNRIIVGLAQCLIVAEAGMPSGTMITVDYAINQSKSIFAIPGSIASATSAGTNYLIKCGCKCAVDPKDVLLEYGILKTVADEFSIPESDDFNDTQRDILRLLSVEGMSAEELCEGLSVEADELNTAIMMLEISGYISKKDGLKYELNRQKDGNV